LHHVSISDQVQNISLLSLSLLSQVLDFSSQSIHTLLGHVFLGFRIVLLSSDSIFVVSQPDIFDSEFLLLLLDLSELIPVLIDFDVTLFELVNEFVLLTFVIRCTSFELSIAILELVKLFSLLTLLEF
jgi:hypothetical protein